MSKSLFREVKTGIITYENFYSMICINQYEYK